MTDTDGRCWHEDDVSRTTAAEHARSLSIYETRPDWEPTAQRLLRALYRNAAADEGERYSEAIREANYARIRGYYGLSIPLNDPRLSGRAHIPERRYGCPVLFGLS